MGCVQRERFDGYALGSGGRQLRVDYEWPSCESYILPRVACFVFLCLLRGPGRSNYFILTFNSATSPHSRRTILPYTNSPNTNLELSRNTDRHIVLNCYKPRTGLQEQGSSQVKQSKSGSCVPRDLQHVASHSH